MAHLPPCIDPEVTLPKRGPSGVSWGHSPRPQSPTKSLGRLACSSALCLSELFLTAPNQPAPVKAHSSETAPSPGSSEALVCAGPRIPGSRPSCRSRRFQDEHPRTANATTTVPTLAAARLSLLRTTPSALTNSRGAWSTTANPGLACRESASAGPPAIRLEPRRPASRLKRRRRRGVCGVRSLDGLQYLSLPPDST